MECSGTVEESVGGFQDLEQKHNGEAVTIFSYSFLEHPCVLRLFKRPVWTDLRVVSESD
ncbi:hypothetical protein HanPSC8_Chr17g0796961 [Helianthus annuus]|nr:hypothetical protein HanPSC8_Chr17g0796961 [Helianthus annuus]